MAELTPREWIFQLVTAGIDILADRPDIEESGRYQLHAEPCTRHGARCVCVVFGEMSEHVRWREAEPRDVAALLLDTMLPRPS